MRQLQSADWHSSSREHAPPSAPLSAHCFVRQLHRPPAHSSSREQGPPFTAGAAPSFVVGDVFAFNTGASPEILAQIEAAGDEVAEFPQQRAPLGGRELGPRPRGERLVNAPRVTATGDGRG